MFLAGFVTWTLLLDERGNPMGKRDDLWTQYAQTHDPAVREEIILENIPLVRHVLGRLAIPSLSEETYQDLMGQGIVGLIDAVDRFDPMRGWRFSTYATLRIRGQIIDALRAMDILPRGARRRVKAIERALSRLRTELGREPRDKEIAAEVDLDLKKYHAARLEANCTILSLDTPIRADGGESLSSLSDFLWDDETPDPEETLQETELLQRLENIVRQLPRRTQVLLSLYYCEGLTMKETGHILDLSESRVSQLHARAVKTLRMAFERESLHVIAPARVPVSNLVPAFAFG